MNTHSHLQKGSDVGLGALNEKVPQQEWIHQQRYVRPFIARLTRLGYVSPIAVFFVPNIARENCLLL